MVMNRVLQTGFGLAFFVLIELNLFLAYGFAQGSPDIAWMVIGHSNSVRSVAFSPNNLKVASGGWDKKVKLWQASDGSLLRTFTNHVNNVESVAFSPDSDYLASGSWDRTVKIWRLSDDSDPRTLAEHTDWVKSVCFSSDGVRLASASYDQTVIIWLWSSGVVTNTLDEHTDYVKAVAFSPDRSILASASVDKSIKLWRVADGVLLRTLTGHTQSVESIAFSPDGTKIVSGSLDRSVIIWNVSNGSVFNSLTGHTNGVTSVAFSPDGYAVMSGGLDNTIRVWRTSDGELLKTYDQNTLGVNCVAYSSTGNLFAFGRSDGAVVVARNSFHSDSENLQISMGFTVIQTGHDSCVPVNFVSTVAMTNLSFSVIGPPNYFTNWSISITNELLDTAMVEPIDAAQARFSINSHSGSVLEGSVGVGMVCFDALPVHSAFTSLRIANVQGIESDGTHVSFNAEASGRVVVVGLEPLVEASIASDLRRLLTLYGKPGASYLTEYSTELTTTNWADGWRVPMTNLYQTFEATGQLPQVFYRAKEFFADPPILDIDPSSTRSNIILLLYGRAGTNYSIEAITNLAPNTSWSSATNFTLTNSYRFIDMGGATNPMMFFRAKRP